MGDVYLTQLYAEALTQPATADVRLTQVRAEVLSTTAAPPDVRMTQLLTEVLVGTVPEPLYPAGSFPPTGVLMAAPSQVHSWGVPVTVNGPVLSGDYGTPLLVDGAVERPCRLVYGTAQITLDLGVAQTPNLVGLLNHNIDFDRVIGIMNDAGLARGFGARDPNCWIDLRGFPTTARYWTLIINENSVPISIGEIVIATATVFRHGLWEGDPPFIEKLTYPGYRDLTEYQQVYLSSSGALLRTSETTIRVDETDRAKLAAIFTEVFAPGAPRRRVLVAPSSRINDLWFCEWPVQEPWVYENVAERTLTLPLYDTVGSVLNGR